MTSGEVYLVTPKDIPQLILEGRIRDVLTCELIFWSKSHVCCLGNFASDCISLVILQNKWQIHNDWKILEPKKYLLVINIHAELWEAWNVIFQHYRSLVRQKKCGIYFPHHVHGSRSRSCKDYVYFTSLLNVVRSFMVSLKSAEINS